MGIICEILRLRKNCIKDYINMHANSWPDLIRETKASGIQQQFCFLNGNAVIVITQAKNGRDLLISSSMNP
ncbi:unnamed protein product [marine sediment metagenome]|uniref:L-rhamnose mutarotase n=1 Tax=marine sediment metagenome TaxID=412755 RepID=X1AUT7_9ZZZZ